MAELLTDEPEAHQSSFNLGMILHVLFKHKWKILVCAIAGIIAAVSVRMLYAPMYESYAKLLVRYVLERTPIDPEAQKMGSNVIVGETEILNSWDLAVQVAEALGPKRLLPNVANPSALQAAGEVAQGLSVWPNPNSNIIVIAYRNRDPEIAKLVLEELLNRYFTKHLEVHRSAGAFDFVTQQADQVRSRLGETEDALEALKSKAGIISYQDTMNALSARLGKVEEALQNGEEDVADQAALVKSLEDAAAAANDSKQPRHEPSAADGQHYQAIVARLTALRQGELDLRAKYLPDSPMVKSFEKQLSDLEKQKAGLEQKFPDLAATTPGAPQPSLTTEKTRLAAMQAKLERLRTRRANMKEAIKRLTDISSQIADLERNKELELANYKYFKGALEKARIDEALDPSKMPNISTVQRPTSPAQVFGKRDKIVMGLAGGGIGAAIALTLLVELILRPKVQRPLDLEKQLGTRLLISVPYWTQKKRRRLMSKSGANGKNGKNGSNGSRVAPPWEAGHFIRPYSEAVRDRISLYFELNRMTHKPKLVGVTSFKEGSGASTLAAGLAAAFSETGEGKVLLVDANFGPGDAHSFFNGRPAISLGTDETQAHLTDGMPAAAENLYLAVVGPQQGRLGPSQLGLKKFLDLVPNLKASDFDYIIFDLPPLTQTSPTLGMAGFMDKLLLVVEAEAIGRETVKRGYEALLSGRDNVSIVFNKARSYVPQWLHSES